MAANWVPENAVPSGAVSAVVGNGSPILAQVLSISTPSYSGTLTLENNATLRFNQNASPNSDNTGHFNAFGTGIILKDNTRIETNTQADPIFPTIELQGAATFAADSYRAHGKQIMSFHTARVAAILLIITYRHTAHVTTIDGITRRRNSKKL